MSNTLQNTVNIFSDGLNTDLHPLTTPNTVLTDCINGTVITFNGNEFILQNDMGNYKLKKAQLPADYIPVGIKEYGSIIYIVSYNPIDKKCQIGSYPSPQTLFDNTQFESDKDTQYHGIQINQLDEHWTWNKEGDKVKTTRGESLLITEVTDVLFTQYSPNQNITVLIPEDGDIKDTFLNPGDKYWLYNEKLNPEYKKGNDSSIIEYGDLESWVFQKINYYTLTDTKEVYKTEDVVEKGSEIIVDSEMPYVTWETPGWLGYKPSLLSLESFNIFLTNVTLPSFLEESNNTKELRSAVGKLSFTAQAQATINSSEEWVDNFQNLRVLFEYKIGEGEYVGFEYPYYTPPIDTYGNKIDVVTYSYNSSDININETDKIITVRATPYLRDNKNGLGIVFDNFKVEYQINLNTLKRASEIEIFDTYKYLVDTSSITINFSVLSPTTQVEGLLCKYKIYDLDSNPLTPDYIPINDINWLGQNVLDIEFGVSPWENIKKEEIYLLEVAIFKAISATSTNPETEELLYNSVQCLITSEIMNDSYSKSSRFQDLTINEWTSSINKHTVVNYTNPTENTKLISKYIRVFNDKDIFNDSFYTNNNKLDEATGKFKDTFPTGNYIHEFTDDSEDAENASNKVLNDENADKLSAYFGCFNSYYGSLDLKVERPLIISNTGIWANSVWKTKVEAIVNTSINNIQTSTSYKSDEFLVDKHPIIDNTAKIVYAKALLNQYNSKVYKGKTGDRWYLYNNIMYGLYRTIDGFPKEWSVHTILQELTKNDPQFKWDENTFYNLANKSFCINKYKKYVLRVGQTALRADRTRVYVQIATEAYNNEYFDFKKLNGINEHRGNISKDEASSPQVSWLDGIFANKFDAPWWGFPVFLYTYSGGGNRAKMWAFPDKWSIKHYSGRFDSCSYFAIPCKSGVTKSLTILKLFPKSFDEKFYGDYFGGASGSDTTTWAISTLKKVFSGKPPYVNNIFPEGSNEQYMSQCMAVLFFVFGIHLYGVYNIREDTRQYISSQGNSITTESSKKISVKYNREDSLTELKYNIIDLKVGSSEEQLLSIKNKITNKIQIKDLNIVLTNLIGSISNSNVKTNKTINHTFSEDILLNELVGINFNYLLSIGLTKRIQDFEDSKFLTENSVYHDYYRSAFSKTLDTFARLLQFEFNDNIGYFYYKGLPGPQSGFKTEDGNGAEIIRAVDLSNDIKWDLLYTAVFPTNEFIKREVDENKTNS